MSNKNQVILRKENKEPGLNGTYLSTHPKILALVGRGRMAGRSFCEINRRRRSRRGIRENFSQSFDRSRTLEASVFCYTPARVLA